MSHRRLAATVTVLLGVAGASPATAATIPVTTLADVVDPADGACALREAVLAVSAPPGTGDCARADANANTISLGAGEHVLSRAGASENAGATGDLDVLAVTVSLTLTGAGPGATTIVATGLGDRLLDIASGGPAVTLEKLTLTGGRAPSGSPGGANTSATGGAGEPGGAIRSLAALTLTDVAATDNRAGDGGTGGTGTGNQAGGTGGAGGSGGAVEITGPLTLKRVEFSFNFAGSGGPGGAGATAAGGGSAGGPGGLGGSGGAVASQGGPAIVTGSRFDGNRGGAGGAGGFGGDGPRGWSSGNGGPGGAGGRGGGLFVVGSASVTASTFTANAAGAGGAGGPAGDAPPDGDPGAGGAGAIGASGGAILSQSGQATFVNVTLVGNRAGTGGAGGVGGFGRTGAAATSGGNGGAGGPGGNGGGLRRQLSGAAYLTHASLAGNFAGAGGAGGAGGTGGSNGSGGTPPGATGAVGTAGSGGGIADGSISNSQFTSVTNSILSANTGGNCVGGVSDGGHNLAFGDGSCEGFFVADPKLGALQDNGGPVETLALLPGSPAIEQVPAENTACAATDARGVARPSPGGGLCDIGAFEVTPPACQAAATAATAGQPTVLQLICTHPANAPFTFAVLTQPAHGTLSALDPATGKVTYTAAADYVGPDSFGFQGTVADGSASATASLTVAAPPPGRGPGGTPSAPRLSALKISPKRFRAKKFRATKPGTRVTFTLDRAASVRFTVVRQLKGRRSGNRCVAPRPGNRGRKSCTRTVTVRGSFTRAGSAGASSFRFLGRLANRRLAPGRYRLRATPSADGASGATGSAGFTVRR
jgi:CSLREA domain-containing protein